MKRLDLVKKKNEWVAQTGSKKVVARARTKEDAVRKTARAAKADSQAVTVKIHKENGQFQEERTYPRKADPPGSKG